MGCKMSARPPDDRARSFGITFREKSVFPISRELSPGTAQSVPDDIVHALYVDKSCFEEMPDHQSYGQNDFQIIRRMQRVLMVAHVTGVEERKVDPADESEGTHEQSVEPLRFENTLVHQFVQRVDGERGYRTVKKYHRDNCPPRPAANGIESTASGRDQKSQVPQRLNETSYIALSV